MDYKSPEEIDGYVLTNSSFIDYKRFEGDANGRASTKRAFIEGQSYVPRYDYPNLDKLYDDSPDMLADKKTKAYEAILELEAHKASGIMSENEFELYASYHENRLKKIMLVEAAKRMMLAGSSTEQDVVNEEFMALNKEVYGDIDTDIYEGIMHTELERVTDFIPANDRAGNIKHYLEGYFLLHGDKLSDAIEAPLLGEQTLADLHELIESRYGHIFSVVPDTADDRIYSAEECVSIMQSALDAGDLSKYGWQVEIDAEKTTVATNVGAKRIYLPSDTTRTAAQLRRLIIHEQEVHARRGQNGANVGIKALETGTADYADVEEGLGVLLESVVAGNFDNQSSHRARDRYIVAGLAMGVDGQPKDARDTFEVTWRLLALRYAVQGIITPEGEATAKKQAMVHIENAFRGTDFLTPGIIYTKLKVYYEGLTKNAAYFNESDDIEASLDLALTGKFNHVDKHEAETVGALIQAKTVSNNA